MEKQPNKRQISFDEVQKFARDRGCLCMEGSALSGKNVNEMFEAVVRKHAENLQAMDEDGGASKYNNASAREDL